MIILGLNPLFIGSAFLSVKAKQRTALLQVLIPFLSGLLFYLNMNAYNAFTGES